MKRFIFACLIVGLAVQTASTQSLSYSRGQNVSPAFEGWEKNDDGSFNMIFGYMNRNWEEEPDVPIGPDNNISPGPADQGQPTHFQPRRNRFVFKVKVPKDWGTKELVWTLTTRGKTEKAFATLREDSLVDNIVQASENGALGAGVSSPAVRANIAPDLTIDTGERRAQIGQPLTLVAVAKDDGVPRPRYGPDSRESERVAAARARDQLDSAGAGGARHDDVRSGRAASAFGNHRRQPDGLAAFVFRLSRHGTRLVHAAPGQGVGRHACGRELTVGAALDGAGGSRGRQVSGERDVPGSRRLHDSLPGVRRRAQHLQRRRRPRQIIAITSD